MKTNPLTAQLKEHTLSHGIDQLGITSAKPFVRQGREKEIIDPLRKTLVDPNPQIRVYSAWSLGRIDSAKAQRILANVLKMEGKADVRKEIQHALGG